MQRQLSKWDQTAEVNAAAENTEIHLNSSTGQNYFSHNISINGEIQNECL